MKYTGKFALSTAVAITVATLMASSAFADERPRNETWRDRNRGDRSDIQEQRRAISAEGRIRSLSRDGDGYRVNIDGHRYPFYVSPSSFGSRGRRFNDLRVGVSVRLSGWLRGGYVYVDAFDWVDRYDDYRYDDRRYRDRYDDRDDRGRYGSRYLTGIVEQVNYRRGTLVVLEGYRGRRVTVDLDRQSRGRSYDLRDLRRGDRVTLAGAWIRNDVFEAYRIESVR